MALLFSGTQRVEHVSTPSLDGLDSITVMAWYMALSTASGAYSLFSKSDDPAGNYFFANRPAVHSGPNDWQYYRSRSGTPTIARSNGNIVQANRWEWICFLDSDGAAPEILHGTLTTPAAEIASYYTRQTGVGAPVGTLGRPVNVGNADDYSQPFGVIAFFALYDRRMSQAEALAHQYRPWPAPGAVLFTHMLGTDGVRDLSPYGNHGTVAGATVTDHAPYRFFVPHSIVVAQDVAPTTTVGRSAPAAWNARELATADAPLGWNVSSAVSTVGRSAPATWGVLSEVGRDAAAAWDVRELTGRSAPAEWGVLSTVGRGARAVWNVNGTGFRESVELTLYLTRAVNLVVRL